MDIIKSTLGMAYVTSKDIQDIGPGSMTHILKRAHGQPKQFKGFKYLTSLGVAKLYAQNIAKTLDESADGQLSEREDGLPSRYTNFFENLEYLLQYALDSAIQEVKPGDPKNTLAAQRLLNLVSKGIGTMLIRENQ